MPGNCVVNNKFHCANGARYIFKISQVEDWISDLSSLTLVKKRAKRTPVKGAHCFHLQNLDQKNSTNILCSPKQLYNGTEINGSQI